jgi:hypothetical protein
MTIKSLASQMPSVEGVAKVGGGGKGITPFSLAARMPSPEIAAKVGGPKHDGQGCMVRRVRRRNAQA